MLEFQIDRSYLMHGNEYMQNSECRAHQQYITLRILGLLKEVSQVTADNYALKPAATSVNNSLLIEGIVTAIIEY